MTQSWFLRCGGRLLVILAAIGLLAACAVSPIDQQVKAGLRTVAVTRDIALVDRPTVITGQSGGAFLFGGALGMAIEQKTSDMPGLLVQAMAKQGIDLRALYREAFIRQIQAKGYTVVDDPVQADAQFRMLLPINYGLTGDPFSSKPWSVPFMMVRMELVKGAAGSQLWWGHLANNTDEGILNQLERRSLQDYLSDGALLRREFEKAADLMAKRLAERL